MVFLSERGLRPLLIPHLHEFFRHNIRCRRHLTPHMAKRTIKPGDCPRADIAMPTREILTRVLQNCDYRFRTIQCPQQKKPAEVTAAKWQISDDHWTMWTIVDCSLLPAGEIWCGRKCLPLVESSPNGSAQQSSS